MKKFKIVYYQFYKLKEICLDAYDWKNCVDSIQDNEIISIEIVPAEGL